MTDPGAIGKEVQSQILDTTRKSQQAIVGTLAVWSETAKAITSALPVPPPVADKLPMAAVIVSSACDLAGQLLASQRKLAEDVLRLCG